MISHVRCSSETSFLKYPESINLLIAETKNKTGKLGRNTVDISHKMDTLKILESDKKGCKDELLNILG